MDLIWLSLSHVGLVAKERDVHPWTKVLTPLQPHCEPRWTRVRSCTLSIPINRYGQVEWMWQLRMGKEEHRMRSLIDGGVVRYPFCLVMLHFNLTHIAYKGLVMISATFFKYSIVRLCHTN